MRNGIDAVAMTRAIRDAHHEALKDATVEERLQFYRDKAHRMQERMGTQAPGSGRPARGNG